jgi:leader peptidase (prepilin peptidase)/N-methyltransferase
LSDSGLLLDDPLMSIAGLFIGGGSLYALDMLSLLLLRKRGMGFGDVKLMAMLGAFFGVWGVVLIIVLASFFGSIIGVSLILIGRRQTQEMEEGGGEGHYLPFGPYIVLGAIVYLFYGPQIIQRYLDYISVPGAI